MELWSRIDAIVLQWIYGTISNDLLHTILKLNTSASQAWQALAGIFQDNQNSRVVYLEHKFVTTRLENYPNMFAYCQAFKMLSEQLTNVVAPITNQRLVLQLLAGLTKAYSNIAMMIQQTTPLPDFYEVRSRLILEETRQAHLASTAVAASNTALHTTTHQQPPATSMSSHSSDQQPQSFYQRGRGRGKGRSHGRGRSNNSTYTHGRGQHYSPNNGYWASNWQQTRPTWQYPTVQQWTNPPSPWVYPPCPYPTAPIHRPEANNSSSPGILGSRPQQVYPASEVRYTPTDLDRAFNTMSLNPPENTWYTDTGATSHMANNSGLPDTHPLPPM